MKCNLQKQNRGASGLGDVTYYASAVASMKENELQNCSKDAVDLNKYLFHAVGSYTGRENIVKRVESILTTGAILSEDFQSLVCDKDIVHLNEFSTSPKLNGKNRISICQKDSYIEY